jgi:aryl-alcohol dehydrogenase-like predicted oxidoreductase
MEYRRLGNSGLRVPVLSFGTATFGGGNDLFKLFGSTSGQDASRLVGLCLDHGVNLFDTADFYSQGLAEEVLAAALGSRRKSAILCTKAVYPMGAGPNDYGASRTHILDAIEGSLRRLKTDYIDLFYLHGFDEWTPVEETLATLDLLVRAGKIRYVGCSNFFGWHLMKHLAAADRHGFCRPIAHQINYSLITRNYEWELMPLGLDQGVGAMIWGPLGFGQLTGKIRRGVPARPGTRAHDTAGLGGPSTGEERLLSIVDALIEIGEEVGKTVAQVAINWLLQRPTVASVILGARTEEQLRDNLGAVGWSLTREQVARLDKVSAVELPHPVSHHRGWPMLVRSTA